MLRSTKINKFIRFFRSLILSIDKPSPLYTNHLPEGLRLHIGPGHINLQGWVNIDAIQHPHTHIVDHRLELGEFADCSVTEIYACHILEHISHRQIRSVLSHFYAKLREGGVIRVSVPSFDALIELYQLSDKNINSIQYPVMGGQEDDFNYHKTIYNYDLLKLLLLECGFKSIREWSTEKIFGESIGDWSSYKVTMGNKVIPISINLEGIK